MSAAYRDKGLLESAVARPFQTACGRYIHRGVTRRAAALFHSLIANHPFADGNKRTAVVALSHFLVANGLLLLITPNDMYNLAMKTASGNERRVSQDELLNEITKALKLRTVPISKLRGIRLPLQKDALALKRRIRANPLNQAEEQGQPARQGSLPFSG